MAKGKGTGGDFDLQDWVPYLLNQAAEATSRGFQDTYCARHGLPRTQWRVMANLGRFGAMTARDICHLSHIEKTKVSRTADQNCLRAMIALGLTRGDDEDEN
jgi:hypothetical protein